MAVDVVPLRETAAAPDRAAPTAASAAWSAVRKVLLPAASLKLTVGLFALAIFLVFASTLAQTHHDIWEIVNNWYRVDERKLFDSQFPWIHLDQLFVWIRFQYFFPSALFPERPQVPGGMWFPRGWLIGLAMAVNLLAAHTVRFTIQASGMRLWAGLGVIALGCLATWAAVASGSSTSGVLSGAVISWDHLWRFMLMGLATLAFAAVVALLKFDRRRQVERWTALLVALTSGGLLAYALYYGKAAQISAESTRILWQLMKGTAAGLVLLAGCRMVFNKRAGIVVLHAGIGLMFVYEIIVGTSHEETEMTLLEGQSSGWVQDIRYHELAIVRKADGSDKAPTEDTVIAVPQRLLFEGSRIALPADVAPFDVRVVKKFRNSTLREAKAGDANPATHGFGLGILAEEIAPVRGTDSSGAIDMPSMYVELVNKSDGKSLGTYLVGLPISVVRQRGGMLPEDVVVAGDKTFTLDLRPKRTYKPYEITLKEVRKDDYVASDKPRNYSSVLRVVDHKLGVDREEPIRMNNPMRFENDTFYQHGYNEMPDGRKMSTIQVVANVGWMLPYVSCMIVVVGCAAQFGVTLNRFLNRRQLAASVADTSSTEVAASHASKRAAKPATATDVPVAAGPHWAEKWLPIAMVAAVLLMTARTMYVPKPKADEMDLYGFGKLPVAYESRVKPLDSMARSTLAMLSQRQTFKADLDDDAERSKPAIRWLLDMMTEDLSESSKVDDYQVFRIDNIDLLKALGIERNKHSRYSYRDILRKEGAFKREVEQAEAKLKQDQGGPYEREVGKLKSRMDTYFLIRMSFLDPGLQLPSEAQRTAAAAAQKDPYGDVVRKLAQSLLAARTLQNDHHPPLAVPQGSESWGLYPDVNARRFTADVTAKAAAGDPAATAFVAHVRTTLPELLPLLTDKPVSPAAAKVHALLAAYKRNDAAAFNAALADYRSYLETNPPHEYDRARRDQEAYLNHAEPFFWSSWYYLAGFVLTAVGWLGWGKAFNRAAFATILTAFVIHSLALVWRMYVSERPPVINLYSSAVFIGWGAVVFGLVFEAVYKLGIGNVVAGIAGFGSLQIAHLLSRQGDTIEALQAVLDTQFWLTTHVVCVTLGYAVTYVAGLLGAIYVVRGLLTKSLSSHVGKELARMIYGTLCFALFFSFFGTVLGGLWADDSWGRFWGWDPKENGALIIVLWNALVLHARWDGFVKDRGLAVLALFGNITTSWSWFGVNQLGVGLHAYGFSQELLDVLFWFVVGSAAIVACGMIPRKYWFSAKNLAAA